MRCGLPRRAAGLLAGGPGAGGWAAFGGMVFRGGPGVVFGGRGRVCGPGHGILGRFDAWRDFRVAAGGAGLGCWWWAWYMGVAS